MSHTRDCYNASDIRKHLTSVRNLCRVLSEVVFNLVKEPDNTNIFQVGMYYTTKSSRISDFFQKQKKINPEDLFAFFDSIQNLDG